MTIRESVTALATSFADEVVVQITAAFAADAAADAAELKAKDDAIAQLQVDMSAQLALVEQLKKALADYESATA